MSDKQETLRDVVTWGVGMKGVGYDSGKALALEKLAPKILAVVATARRAAIVSECADPECNACALADAVEDLDEALGRYERGGWPALVDQEGGQ